MAVSKAGVPCRIVHSHNAGDTSSSKIKKAAFEALKPQLEKNATLLLACSQKAAGYMFTDKTVREGKVQIIKNGIQVERFRYNPQVREQVRQELDLADRFVVGHVGRFNKQKNHAFLLKVFEKIHEKEPASVLLLFGKGDLEPEIRALTEELGLTSCVRFMGEVADIERMYQAMDVFVMPSFHEGLPVSCVEIQAAGVPCVLSDTITEEIKIADSMRFLSLSDSTEAWAEAALDQKGNRDTDGYENVIRSGYAIRDVADGMLAIYKALDSKLH
jgi:glycosyltransferase involved in cell wall biosynthesis